MSLAVTVLFVWFRGFDSNGYCLLPDSLPSKNFKGRVLPSFYYLPETRIAAGALAYTLFNWKSDTLNKASNTQHYISFTQNKQVLFENSWQLFTHKNLWIWRGNADFSRFPEYYFGIGNHEAKPEKILYGSKRVVVKNQALRQFKFGAYTGIAGHFERLDNIKVLSGTPKSGIEAYLQDLKNFIVFGIGPTFVFDTRDFVVTPSRGNLLEASLLHFFSTGKPSFSILSLEYRHFIPIHQKKTILGFQAIFKQGFGEIPFRLLPTLGGADMLRGSYAGRFRDQMTLGIQVECRAAVYKRFGIALFTGFGEMGDNLFQAEFKPKGSIGLGLRYRLHKNENVNLRIDFARGLNSNGLYVVLAEAF